MSTPSGERDIYLAVTSVQFVQYVLYVLPVYKLTCLHNHSSHMTSCDNHKTSTSFNSTKMKKEEEKIIGENIRFKLTTEAGPKASFAERKIMNVTRYVKSMRRKPR